MKVWVCSHGEMDGEVRAADTAGEVLEKGIWMEYETVRMGEVMKGRKGRRREGKGWFGLRLGRGEIIYLVWLLAGSGILVLLLFLPWSSTRLASLSALVYVRNLLWQISGSTLQAIQHFDIPEF
jgi:hypothetical protein